MKQFLKRRIKMEVEVRKEIFETVIIETPYYYKHEFDDSSVYGKIEEDKVTSINVPYAFCDKEYTMEIEEPTNIGCYTKSEYKSNKEEWKKAVKLFKTAVENSLI